MQRKGNILAAIRFVLSSASLRREASARIPFSVPRATRYSTDCLNQTGNLALERLDGSERRAAWYGEQKKNSSEVESEREGEELKLRQTSSKNVLRNWGCSEDEISKLFSLRPILQRTDAALLESRLYFLTQLGLTPSDLVTIISTIQWFLSCRSNSSFEERLNYFAGFFGSKELLRKAIIRNPKLITYDLHKKVKPVIELYKELGLSREDLIQMLVCQPTLISRTRFNSEKMEYIRKTGVSSESKMFKYIAVKVGVTKLETIHEKVANFEKFGVTEEDAMRMIGRAPLILGLSIEKVQRNMTYAIASMKLPAHKVLYYPFLLFCNLETHIRPRVLLSKKIEEMDLKPQIQREDLMRVLRMSEKRLLRVYVLCHPKEVAAKLMELYEEAKAMKRLAEGSKKNLPKGFHL